MSTTQRQVLKLLEQTKNLKLCGFQLQTLKFIEVRFQIDKIL